MVWTLSVVEAWAEVLAFHPDRAFAYYICSGLKFGFRIGFADTVRLKSATANMGSSCEHPAVVSDHLTKELSLGRMLGPFSQSARLPPCKCRSLGAPASTMALTPLSAPCPIQQWTR